MAGSWFSREEDDADDEGGGGGTIVVEKDRNLAGPVIVPRNSTREGLDAALSAANPVNGCLESGDLKVDGDLTGVSLVN